MSSFEPDIEPDIRVSKLFARDGLPLSRVLSMVLTLAELFWVDQIP